VITPPAQTPTAGIPANFTFAVTAAGAGGSAIRSLIVDWGDSSVRHDYQQSFNLQTAGNANNVTVDHNTALQSDAILWGGDKAPHTKAQSVLPRMKV